MDATGQQHRRMTAAALFEQGRLRGSRIAQMLGVTTRAVNHWHRAWRQEGTAALISKGPTGPDRLLTDHRQHELRQILRRGAKDYGCSTDGWILARIRRVITETFGVAYADVSGVWRLPHRMGWTNRLPARGAVERDEHAIAEWVEHTRPDIEKRGAETGAWICFADESGTSLTGAVERTWAPAGQTPTPHVVKRGPVQAVGGRAVLVPARAGASDALSDSAGLVPRPRPDRAAG